MRSVPYRRVLSLDDVYSLVAAEEQPLVLVFDVDNTIVSQGAPRDEFAAAVHEARDRFESLPVVARVVVLTNGPQRGVAWMESRGNKPWT